MGILMFILSLIFVYLYIMNIFRLFENGMSRRPVLVVVRVIGIFFPFLGVVLGVIPNR